MRDSTELTDTWRERFTFYATYGRPSSSRQAREAYKQLPLWTRMRMGWNSLAFLFGPLYFFTKGLWRKGIALLLAVLAQGTILVLLGTPEKIVRAVSVPVPAIAAITANYAYYLHVVMQSRSWNPLEGFGRKRTPK